MKQFVGRTQRVLSAGAALVTMLLQSGCLTMRAYEGVKLDRNEVARIAGDWRFSSGAPLVVLLRRVDGVAVGARYGAIDVTPGRHHLLVDCTVTSTKLTTRFNLDVEVLVGRYRLVADTQPGNRKCGDVRLISRGPIGPGSHRTRTSEVL